MSSEKSPEAFTLNSLADRCTQETEKFFQRREYDSRYCYELFRRAIAERDTRAWALVYNQYRSLVLGWVKQHPAFLQSGEEAQYFYNRSFEKMWMALTPEKFERFPNLKSLLSYLQMCVHSTILDYRLARQRELQLSEVRQKVTGHSVVESQVLARVDQEAFWQEINAKLYDDQERVVLYSSFVLGLKPREIYARGGNLFNEVKEIYRIKEKVMARLGRDTELQQRLRDFVEK